MTTCIELEPSCDWYPFGRGEKSTSRCHSDRTVHASQCAIVQGSGHRTTSSLPLLMVISATLPDKATNFPLLVKGFGYNKEVFKSFEKNRDTHFHDDLEALTTIKNLTVRFS
jgi:hypothetical protein